jgi:hypothetical protein
MEGNNFAAQIKAILVVAILASATWFAGCQASEVSKETFPDPPRTLVDDSIPKTIELASQDGWVPCPGNCLKLATPGWHHQHVDGYADTDIWFSFDNDHYTAAFSQRHIGHIIQTSDDQPAKDGGICPICQGTGWVRKELPKPDETAEAVSLK